MNDLEKMKKEVEQKKKALNTIYDKESVEDNFANVKLSLLYTYTIIKEKMKNAEYRYDFTKDPELKGERDAYNDILVLLETKFTFLTRTNNVQSNNEDSIKLPDDGIVRRLRRVNNLNAKKIVCPYCYSSNAELINKITRVNNWDAKKVENVSAKYKCLDCGNQFGVLFNGLNEIQHIAKIPYSDGTDFCFTTKENKDVK